jgi:hypothetical protein
MGLVDDPSCDRCGHPFSPHVLVMLESAEVAGVPDVPVAGVIFCPDCDCVATWSIAGHPPSELPGPEELRRIRESVFLSRKARPAR